MSEARRRKARRPPVRHGLLRRRVGPMPVWALGAVVFAAISVVGIAVANTYSGGSNSGGSYGGPEYAVGRPGVGEIAPDFQLPSTRGGTYQLSAQHGQTVLLYFHEGLMCAPCWQQVFDIQRDLVAFTDIGVDEVVAISVDRLSAQAAHSARNGVTILILADEDRAVSARYDALAYGMMNGRMPGHTFILVGPEGTILWRADYGGAPDFTMYVPPPVLVAELQHVLAD